MTFSSPSNSFRTGPLASITLHRLLVGLVAIALSPLVSADYSVQIGAFRNPSESFVAAARSVGTVYAVERSNGVRAIMVGNFADRSDADSARETLMETYPGAFVTTASPTAVQFAEATGASTLANNSPAQAQSSATGANGVRRTSNATEAALLDGLTEEERRRVVYLDGKLHLKNGNDFTPLSEYSRR
ncbi:MAG: SPOR domain-containing protein [Pseudomonadota bacterium]